MKQITNYIIEKANFLVKKHVNPSATPIFGEHQELFDFLLNLFKLDEWQFEKPNFGAQDHTSMRFKCGTGGMQKRADKIFTELKNKFSTIYTIKQQQSVSFTKNKNQSTKLLGVAVKIYDKSKLIIDIWVSTPRYDENNTTITNYII